MPAQRTPTFVSKFSPDPLRMSSRAFAGFDVNTARAPRQMRTSSAGWSRGTRAATCRRWDVPVLRQLRYPDDRQLDKIVAAGADVLVLRELA